jgi:hypothetical protein
VGAIEAFLNRGEQLGAQADRSEKPPEYLAYIRIVVYDDDGRLSLAIGNGHSRSGRPLPAR